MESIYQNSILRRETPVQPDTVDGILDPYEASGILPILPGEVNVLYPLWRPKSGGRILLQQLREKYRCPQKSGGR